MSYNLTNARLLSLDQSNEFFDSDFRFGSRKTLSVEGYFLDLMNDMGVSGVTADIESFRTGLEDYRDVYLNGVYFGKGRVTSLNVDNGNHVKLANYTLGIECFESGNLFNLGLPEYSGLERLNSELTPSHLLKNFSEEFSFDRSTDSYSYTHSVSFNYISGDNVVINPVDRGKALATYLMGSQVNFGFIQDEVSGFYTGNHNVYFDEQYDAINNEVSITKRFESFNPSGNYSLNRSHSFEVSPEGISTVSESSEIKVSVGDKALMLPIYMSQEASGSYSRCQGVASYYSPTCVLSTAASNVQQVLNPFDGIGQYNVSYTDDPSFYDSAFTWQSEVSIEKTESFYSIIENGEILGIGTTPYNRYENAVSGYKDIKSGAGQRITGLYSSMVGGVPLLGLTTFTETRSRRDGSISYGAHYSDDPTTTETGIAKFEQVIADSIPVDHINKFGIIHHGEVVQEAGTTTAGSRSLHMTINGGRDSTFEQALDLATRKANESIPTGNTPFVENASYTFSPITKEMAVEIGWFYARPSREKEVL